MTVRSKRIAAVAAILLSLSGTALAHTGHGDTSSFTHGLGHPLGGLDHTLAMVAVGLYAALLGGRALWFVPATFAAVMAFGGVVGGTGYALPYVEIAIALSVVVLGFRRATLEPADGRRHGAGRRVRDLPRTRARRRDAAGYFGIRLRGGFHHCDCAVALRGHRDWSACG